MFKQAFLTRKAGPFLLMFAGLLCLSAESLSFAQTTLILTKEGKNKDIISRRHAVDSMLIAFEERMPTIVDAYKKHNPSITTAQVEEMIKVLRNSIDDLKPSLENMFVEIYLATYNDEQIDSLYAFYSTPLGTQVAEKEQALTAAAGLQVKLGR
jgi:hypothetical protein